MREITIGRRVAKRGSMRTILIAILLLGTTRAARADFSDVSDYDSAMKMQIRGATLMGAGIYHLVGATIAGGFAVQEYKCGRTAGCESWGVGTAAAWSTLALGIIFTAAGIPTYIEGTTRLHKMKVIARLDLDGLRVAF
jgi:hypothetical protein